MLSGTITCGTWRFDFSRDQSWKFVEHSQGRPNNNAEWVSPSLCVKQTNKKHSQSNQPPAGGWKSCLDYLDAWIWRETGKPTNPSWKKKVSGQKKSKFWNDLFSDLFRVFQRKNTETTTSIMGETVSNKTQKSNEFIKVNIPAIWILWGFWTKKPLISLPQPITTLTDAAVTHQPLSCTKGQSPGTSQRILLHPHSPAVRWPCHDERLHRLGTPNLQVLR